MARRQRSRAHPRPWHRGCFARARRTHHGSAEPTIDHDRIRQWAEARRGQPARVKGRDILRLDFPGYSGEDTLEPISWDDWFRLFDENNLALLIQERKEDGEPSTFNKLVSRAS